MTTQKKRLVDFRKVKDSVSITQVIDRYGLTHTLKKRGDRLEGPCPIHGGESHRSFSVTPSKNTWYCFGECEQGGNILDLVAAIERCGIRDAAILIADWFSLSDVQHKAERKSGTRKSGSRKRSEKKSHAPAEDELCVEDETDRPRPGANEPLTFELKTLEPDHDALIARGIMSDTAEHFGAGYCKRGLLKGRFAIPVHNSEGQLLAYAGAATEPEQKPPYLWPEKFDRTLELFNLHRVYELDEPHSPLIVVCDVLDVFQLYELGREHVVALMDNTISENQLSILGDYLSERRISAVHFIAKPNASKVRRTTSLLAQLAYVKITLSKAFQTVA